MTLIVHYHEIALKGRNRPFFERKLMKNIQAMMDDLSVKGSVHRMGGRLRIETDADPTLLRDRLRVMPGVAYIAEVEGVALTMPAITTAAWAALKEKEFSTFAVRTKRSNKQFEKNSHDVDVAVGSFLVDALEHDRGEHPEKYTDDVKTHYGWVDLTNPDVTLFIEIVEHAAFVYTDRDRTDGIGGLPLSTAGTVVGLLSSGIDSPVAAFRMIKRGVRVVFVHFHSYPYTSQGSLENVRDLVAVLARSQGASVLYEVPFADIQKTLVDAGHPKLRLLLYRRLFLRIAERIAQREKALGIVTGESIGQVASQTLENIAAVSSVASLPVYRPLSGTNKEEIIEEARRIGTFDIAIRPGDDCCSLFVPDHPETKARSGDLDVIESSLPIDDLIQQALDHMERKEITP